MIEKLTDIKGIGEKRAELLKSLGVKTPQELLCYAPSRYMDFTHINKLAEVNDGEVGAFCVEVLGRPQIVRAKGLQHRKGTNNLVQSALQSRSVQGRRKNLSLRQGRCKRKHAQVFIAVSI